MSNLKYGDLLGAVYDVDDTLLNNHPDDGQPYNLHGRSRLAAVHAIGSELGHSALLDLTPEENAQIFLDAPVHTVDSAIWLTLFRYGIVKDSELDPKNPVLNAIIERKAALHIKLLQAAGVEVAGASDFVRNFEKGGPGGNQAIASGARLEEIQMFLTKYDLHHELPRERIIAHRDYLLPKPHSDPFDLGFKTLKLPDTPQVRSRVLGVEDDPKGYLSSYSAGLFSCVLTTRFKADAFMFDDHRPKLVASDMAELGEMLEVPTS